MRLFEEAGFSPLYATYWNTLLFPVMALRRLLLPPTGEESDVHLYPPPVEALFGALLACERALLRAGRAAAVRRLGAGGGAGGAMADRPALSLVIPCYNSADDDRPARLGARAAAHRRRSRGRPRQRREPGRHRRGVPRAGARRRGAGDVRRPGAQLRRAQRGDGRAAGRARRLRHHHGRRRPEPAGRGGEAVPLRARERQGRRLHLTTRRSSTRAGATSAAGSPTGSPTSCSTSRRASTSRASAACAPSWSSRSAATTARIRTSTDCSCR